ncbi:hypothetical protein INS49_009548 [Diaporthe citri]|uniref:uncharacterized protein n=1 Tax=Diaporthe citri TaxID=83186 RepID=UPI001C81B9E7|nr:uncharacterized protein INS49_009548 [Diaporthe citri]KAG6361323.1 hypothetical protein INS49_009548 [Diaporthe citri]
MSSTPSTKDERVSPDNENDAGSLGAIFPVGDAGLQDAPVRTGTNVTTPGYPAIITGEAATAGTAITSISGVRSVQPTNPLSSLDDDLRQIHAVENSILISPGKGTIDLPNEILFKVFSYISGGNKWRDINKTMWDFSSTSEQDIKNARLSHSQLSVNASRHLIRHVTIDLSEASLANFESISKHPDIYHGVQAVEISLAQYDDGIAKNLELFATHHMNNLPRLGRNSQETRSKAAFISNTWAKYLQARVTRDDTFLDNFDREEIVYIQALVQGYYQYKDRLQEQKNLLQASGSADFIVRMTASMATLPAAKHLEFSTMAHLRNLRSLRFEHYKHLPTNPERDQQGFRSLSRFLDACLESEKLECLIIDPKITFSPEVSLISPRPWPKLKYAVLKRLSLSDSDLETLTASIARHQGGLLIMNYVRLCRGTWAGVLDMLRSRRIRVSLGYQAGAECDIMADWGSEIFGVKHGLGNFAEHYARGEDMPNPILSPPSEELGERLSGISTSDLGGPAIENGETLEDEF